MNGEHLSGSFFQRAKGWFKGRSEQDSQASGSEYNPPSEVDQARGLAHRIDTLLENISISTRDGQRVKRGDEQIDRVLDSVASGEISLFGPQLEGSDESFKWVIERTGIDEAGQPVVTREVVLNTRRANPLGPEDGKLLVYSVDPKEVGQVQLLANISAQLRSYAEQANQGQNLNGVAVLRRTVDNLTDQPYE